MTPFADPGPEGRGAAGKLLLDVGHPGSPAVVPCPRFSFIPPLLQPVQHSVLEQILTSDCSGKEGCRFALVCKGWRKAQLKVGSSASFSFIPAAASAQSPTVVAKRPGRSA